MKKFLTAAAILAALTMTITGCSNNSNSSDNSSSAPQSGVTSEADKTTSEADKVTSDAGTESGSDSETAALTAAQMAANALTAVEWPAMMEIPDAESANMMLSIDPALCEDYYFSTQLMSAQLNEVVIAKPSAGNEAALQEQFDAHFDYIKNGAAFYPAQEESAAGAVMGKTDDGYLYILVHTNGADCEAALLNNPPAEMPGADAGDEGGVDDGFGVDGGDMGMPLSLTMADAAYAAVEWPAMMPVDDPEMINSFFGIDSTICEDYYIANQLISAQLNEIIFVKPLEGMESEIQAQLDAHFQYIKNDAAFYPEQEPSAEGAVMGTLDNGYMYIIVHENGAAVVDAVVAALTA
ncbi:MAG: DUF4358 domain-containing protein [Oscillospiraceae bacterium]|nr:DUF4358 domain-containing protein [Oscillospiraceae bacterium]